MTSFDFAFYEQVYTHARAVLEEYTTGLFLLERALLDLDTCLHTGTTTPLAISDAAMKVNLARASLRRIPI